MTPDTLETRYAAIQAEIDALRRQRDRAVFLLGACVGLGVACLVKML